MDKDLEFSFDKDSLYLKDFEFGLDYDGDLGKLNLDMEGTFSDWNKVKDSVFSDPTESAA